MKKTILASTILGLFCFQNIYSFRTAWWKKKEIRELKAERTKAEKQKTLSETPALEPLKKEAIDYLWTKTTNVPAKQIIGKEQSKFEKKQIHQARRNGPKKVIIETLVSQKMISSKTNKTILPSQKPITYTSENSHHLKILGLNENASQAEIRRAYRRLYLQYNSDRAAKPKLEKLQKAYDSLTTK